MKDGSKSGKESAAVGSKNTIYGNQAYAIGAGNTIGSATVVTTTEANAIRIVLQPIVLMQ